MTSDRNTIAFISINSDPAGEIGVGETGGQSVYVLEVGKLLAKFGWQVDMFTRKFKSEEPSIIQHSPYCRTIRLVAGIEKFVPRYQIFKDIPQFLAEFKSFERMQGINYSLVHTNYWHSAWVGLQLKDDYQIKLVHTYHSIGVTACKN